jgi:hypothetical protein
MCPGQTDTIQLLGLDIISLWEEATNSPCASGNSDPVADTRSG